MTPAARAAALVAAATLASCSPSLPEDGTPDATLYAARCSGCHVPHQPHTLTAKMWEVQVQRMDSKIRSAGRQPPTPDERDKILAYLKRNAGQ